MEELKNILYGDQTERYNHPAISIRPIENGIEVDYHQMYEAPGLSFAMLKKLSEYFGTDKIDVDNYSHRGCETCDHGSSYGHTIQILEPAKNVPEFPRGKDKKIQVMGEK